MIEINSTRINKDLLVQEIEKNIDSFSPRLNLNKKQKKKAHGLEPSLREHYSKAYKIMKRIEHFMHIIGLSKLVHIIKKPLKDSNFKKSNVYLVSDFTKYHDEEFIRNVYLGVLKREPDGFSLEHYLDLLRSGSKSKSEILAIIRFSKEGRVYSVNILGIKIRFFMAVLYKIPILNYFLKSAVALITLPKMMKRYNSLEANYHMNNKNVSVEVAKKVNSSDFRQDMFNIEKLLTDKYEESMQINEVNYKQSQEQYTQIKQQSQEQYTQIKQQVQLYLEDVNNSKAYLREVEHNLKNLMLNIEKSIENKSVISEDIFKEVLEEKEHFLDELYIAFEDKFRGSRADIKQRQEYYLPLVKEVMKDDAEYLIDVGCGRGEWIELLKENFINAKGVDLNRSMVNKAIEYNVDAITMDAISYLKSLKDESISVVTGFHIVEHLPFEVLIALFDESLRVLKKGGMIIFETPNPENLLVGSCTFYTDPTHINPIPPITLEFLATNRGFSNIKTHRLHPIKEPQYIEGLDRDDVNALIFASTKEQDYSIVGYKA